MTRLRFALLAQLAGVAALSGTVFAQGGCADSLLWDNGPPDGTGGYSNIKPNCYNGIDRTLLDDFAVKDPGWNLTCFEWHHVWNNGTGAGFGVGACFDIRANTTADTPGAVIKGLNITSYRDVATGNMFFSRPEILSTVTFDACNLDPGKYWWEGTICGDDNNFWLVRGPILCTECWVNYADLGGLQPGSSVFGVANDLAWRLYGFENDPDRFKFYCNQGDGHPNNTSGIDVSGNVLSHGPIIVCLTGAPANQFTYLLIGNSNGVVNQPPGAKGDLCVTGGNCLGRYAKDIGQIATDGSFCTDIENSLSGGPNFGIPTCGGNIAPGDTWYFQYWHRQPMGQPSTFSEAACVTFKQ